MRWDRVVKIAEQEARAYYTAHGIPLILRGLFYVLVSKGVIPNTKNAYKQLSKVLAEARYLGEFPWELLKDESRVVKEASGQSVADAERIARERASLTDADKERLLNEYLEQKYRIDIWKWSNQQHRVFVVVEKMALFEVFDKMINVDLGWQVSVTTSRGFESATAVKAVADWIKKTRQEGRIPVIVLVFDWDPSGEYASVADFVFRAIALTNDSKAVKKLLRKWEGLRSLDEKVEFVKKLADEHGVVFEKALLTWEQVRKYNLPPEPQDEDTKLKLKRDPRARMFYEKYGVLGQVEVDSMVSMYYDETVRILNDTISKYFDQNAYSELKRHEEDLKKKLQQMK